MPSAGPAPVLASPALFRLLGELGLPADQSEEVATLLGLAVSLARQPEGREIAGGGLGDLAGRLARIEEQQWRMHRQQAATMAAIGRVVEGHRRVLRLLVAVATALLVLNAAVLARLCFA